MLASIIGFLLGGLSTSCIALLLHSFSLAARLDAAENVNATLLERARRAEELAINLNDHRSRSLSDPSFDRVDNARWYVFPDPMKGK